MVAPIFISLRPKEWLENLLVFLPVVFCVKSLSFPLESWLYYFAAFIALCGLSGCLCILNDIIDLPKDRVHPIKRRRPIASGMLSIREAKSALLLIFIVSLFISWKISSNFFALTLGYFMLNVLYISKLKDRLILSLIGIAISSSLKICSGYYVLAKFENSIPLSSWLIIAVFMFSIFFETERKRQKIINPVDESVEQEKNLPMLPEDYLNHLSTLSVAAGIIAYSNYSLSIGNQTLTLVYSLPILTYGLFRFSFFTRCTEEYAESFFELLQKDKASLVGFIIWITMSIAIIHL